MFKIGDVVELDSWYGIEWLPAKTGKIVNITFDYDTGYREFFIDFGNNQVFPFAKHEILRKV